MKFSHGGLEENSYSKYWRWSGSMFNQTHIKSTWELAWGRQIIYMSWWILRCTIHHFAGSPAKCGILQSRNFTSEWGQLYHLVIKKLINGAFNGKIICFYGPFSIAMLNNQRVINHVFIWMCALSHKPCHHLIWITAGMPSRIGADPTWVNQQFAMEHRHGLRMFKDKSTINCPSIP